MTGEIFTKLVLKTVARKLQEKIDELLASEVTGNPPCSNVKKEKDRYSTYLRQVQDVLQLFKK